MSWPVHTGSNNNHVPVSLQKKCPNMLFSEANTTRALPGLLIQLALPSILIMSDSSDFEIDIDDPNPVEAPPPPCTIDVSSDNENNNSQPEASNENDNSAMGYDDAHSSDESEVKMMDWFYLYLKERRKNQHLFGQWHLSF